MIAIDSVAAAKDGHSRQPVSSRIQRLLRGLERLATGPLFWLGLPLLVLVAIAGVP
jgi:hypothetical protein